MSDANSVSSRDKENIWFLVVLFVSKIFFADIDKYVNQSGTAAYMQAAWCAVISVVIFFIISRFAYTDIFNASFDAFGNTGMKIIGTLIAMVLLINSGVMLRVYADIISSIALPEASDFLIIGMLVVASTFAVFAGVDALTSFSYVAGIVLLSILGVILILNIPNYDFENIHPVFGNGVDTIIFGLDGISIYADVFLIFLLPMCCGKSVSAGKVGIGAILIAGVAVTLTALMYILTVPYPAAKEFVLPVLEIAFDVNLDIIFQRAEGLFFFLWIFSGFIVISAYVCFSVLAFERAYNLSDRRGVIGAFLLIASCIALRADTSSLQREVYGMFYTVYTVFAFGMPFVVYVVNRIKRGRT